MKTLLIRLLSALVYVGRTGLALVLAFAYFPLLILLAGGLVAAVFALSLAVAFLYGIAAYVRTRPVKQPQA